MLYTVVPDNAPPPIGAYSPAVVAGGIVYTAGHVGDPTGSFEDEVAGAFRALADTLRAGGSDVALVVRMQCLLADMNDFAAFDAVYRQHVSAPFPARFTHGAALADGYRVELVATAVQST